MSVYRSWGFTVLRRLAEVLVTTSWTFVVENSYRLIQNVATNGTACILGREAAKRNTRLTWDELIEENEKVEVDLTGLKA
jgi:hypothetical protein